MAFEYLDLETKVYLPTQALINQLQIDVISLYGMLTQFMLAAHQKMAVLGNTWYAEPIATSKLWYGQWVEYGTVMYAVLLDEILPQAETTYTAMLTSSNQFSVNVLNNLNYIIDNPEQVSAESIEFMTETLIHVGNVSTEMASELQTKTAEIVELLMQQPLEMLEASYISILTGLLDTYFALVSNILMML